MDSERPSTSNSARPVSRNGPSSPFHITMHILPPSPQAGPLRDDLRISPIRPSFMAAAHGRPSSPEKEIGCYPMGEPSTRAGIHAPISGNPETLASVMPFQSSPVQSETGRLESMPDSMTGEVPVPPLAPTPSRHHDHASHHTPITRPPPWHDAVPPYAPAPDSLPLESPARFLPFDAPSPFAASHTVPAAEAGPSTDLVSQDLFVSLSNSAPVLLASSSDISRPLLTSEPLNRSVSSTRVAVLPSPHVFPPAAVPAAELSPPVHSPPPLARPAKRQRANSLPTLEPDYKRSRTGRARSPLPSESYSRSLRVPRPLVNKLDQQRVRAAALLQRLFDLRHAEMRKFIRSVRITAPLDMPAEQLPAASSAMMEAFGILPFAPTSAFHAAGKRHARKTLRQLLAQPHLLPRLAYHLSVAFEPATAVHGAEHELYWEAVSTELETGCRCVEWDGRYDSRAGYTYDAVVRRRVRRAECACTEGDQGVSRIPALLNTLKARVLALLGPETAHHLSLPASLAETIDPYLPQVQEAFTLLDPERFMALASSGLLRSDREPSDHFGRVMSFLVMSLGAQVERLIGLHAIRRATEDGKWGKAFRRAFGLIRKLEMDHFMRRLLEHKRVESIARRLEVRRLGGSQTDQLKRQVYEASMRVLLDTSVGERSKLFDSALPGSSARVPTKAYAVKTFSDLLSVAASGAPGDLLGLTEGDEQMVRAQEVLLRMQSKAAVLSQVRQTVQSCDADPRWLEQGVLALLDRPGPISQVLAEIAMLVTSYLRQQTDVFVSTPLTPLELAQSRRLETGLRTSIAQPSSSTLHLQKALSILVAEELADLVPAALSTPTANLSGGGGTLSPSPCSTPCAQSTHTQPHLSSSPAHGGHTPRCASPVPLARAALEPGVVFRPHSLYGTMPPLLETGYGRAKRLLGAEGLAGLLPELEGVAEELGGAARYLYGVWGKEMRYTRVMAGASAAVKIPVAL